jgi:hypothetical protein
MNDLSENQKWQLIRELEKQDLPEDTINARWNRLKELWLLAHKLNLKRVEEDKKEIYERWARLKEKYENDLQNMKS